MPSLSQTKHVHLHIRLDQQAPRHLQHRQNLTTRLPVLRAQYAQTHGALVVVGDVGVVDLRGEVQRRGLEGVFGGKGEVEVEYAALGKYVS